MKKPVFIIIILFSVLGKPLSQKTQVQQAASAYAFLIDSVIIKEFRQYPYLKDQRLAFYPFKEFHPSDNDNSSFWKELKFYYDKNTDIKFLDDLVRSSNSFNIKKVRGYSVNAGKISILDSITSHSYKELLKLNGMENTSIFYMSNAVFTKDRKHCIIFYNQFQEGGTTIVLKKNKTGWEIAYKNLDWIE